MFRPPFATDVVVVVVVVVESFDCRLPDFGPGWEVLNRHPLA